jgi:polyhydroxyalkanoic acid synthase PhaR subunit
MTKGVWNVPEDGTPQSSTDLTSLWRQWGETTSKTWSDALEASKEQYTDSYQMYRSWLRSIGDVQEPAKLTPLGMMNPKEVWKLWFDATVGVWRKAAESGGDPLGFITMWLRLMEETQTRILAGEALPTNLFAFYKQWYDATSDTMARLVEKTIGSEKFLELVRPFLESYASFLKTFRNAEEEYLKNLQIPTRSDIAHLAELVIALEEKLDQVDDAFEEGLTQVATRESMAELDKHLNQVESKLDPLPTILDKVGAIKAISQRLGQVESKLDPLPTILDKVGAIEATTQRLGQVESKLDPLPTILDKVAAIEAIPPRLDQVESKLNTLPTVLEKVGEVERLAQRMDQVESKLNTLPTVLEKVGEVERLTQHMDQVEGKLNAVLATLDKLATQLSTTAEQTRPSNTTPSKASRKKTGQQEVKSPESNAGAE